MEFKIFDTLVHSGFSLTWPSKPEIDIRLNSILNLLDKERIIKGALVQNSPWFDSANSLELFFKTIKNYKGSKKIIPVATLPFLKPNKINEYIQNCIDIGFTIFKIHPRFSNHNFEELDQILDFLLPKAVLVQVCTYEYKEQTDFNFTTKENKLIELLAYKSNKYSKNIMLMHGFDISLMHTHNIVRHNKFLILDLSMTILKYDGSSIDDDLYFLFKSFDKRISIGSDYPEWNYKQLENKLSILSQNIPKEKIENIFYGNLENILFS